MSQLDLDQILKRVSEIVEIIGFHVKSEYYIPLMMDVLAQEEFKNSTKNTIVMLDMVSHMLLTSEGLEQHVKEITKVLGHYEAVFYDND